MNRLSHFNRLIHLSKGDTYDAIDSPIPRKNVNISHKIELLKSNRISRLKVENRSSYRWNQIQHLEVIINILEMKKKGI